MCSTHGELLARIGRAIDQLAADSLAPRGARSDASMHARLAGIWDMVAELDPELARRVPDYHPGYHPDYDPGSGKGAGTGAAEANSAAEGTGAAE
jgi:hypothetical protein